MVVTRPLPKSRMARARLIKDNSLGYVRRMGTAECDKLLLSLSKTEGLSWEEQEELMDEFYNVKWEYVPDRLKE